MAAKNYIVKNEVPDFYQETGMKRYKIGADDKLPNKLIRYVDASGTAKSCMGRRRDFIFAKGFIDENIGSAMINVKQTANSLLKEVSVYTSYFEGFFFNIIFNLDGKALSVYHIKAEKLRPMEDGRWRFNERMGEALYKQSEDIYFYTYDPNLSPELRRARIREEVKLYGRQLGDIMMVNTPAAGFLREIYPIPDYYAGIEDIQSDAALQKLENRNIKKGWRANVIIETIGELDDKTKDSDGKTEQDYFDESIRSFTGEEGSSVLHLTSKNQVARARVYPFNLADILDATDKATNRLAYKVCRHTSVPPVLVGLTTPGQLGNTNEIVNHIKLFNLFVSNMKSLIENSLMMIFPEIDWKISTLSVIEELPTWLVAKLTPEEIRILGGYPPKAEGGNNAY